MLRAGCAHPAARFALVGVTNFVVSFSVFYLTYRYMPEALRALVPAAAAANLAAYLAGMVNSFLLNRNWTFRASGDAATQAVRFALVNVASLALSTLVMFVFVDLMQYPEIAVWVPTTLVVMTLNYLGCRHWAFAPSSASHGPRQA